MLRSVLVGVLVVSAAAACSKSESPSAQAGETAGKVVEITGRVTAVRGTERRALTLGATVSADDVIETGDDGRVAILLAHNHARWDVAPHASKRVSASLAWGLARQDTPAVATDHDTASAGRDQEKAGAQTGVTAVTATTERAAAAPVAAPKPAATPPAPPAEAKESAPEKATRGGPPPAEPPPPPPPPPSLQPEPRREAPPQKVASPRADLDKASGGGGGGSRAKGDAAPGATRDGEAPSHGVAAAQVAQDRDVAPAQLVTLLAPHRAKLAACLGTSTKLTVHVKVAAGKRVVSIADGTEAQRTCMQGVVDKLALTTDGDATLTVTK